MDLPGYLMTLTWFPESGVGGVNQAIMHLARVMREHGRWQPFLLVTSDTAIPALHPHLLCPAESFYLSAPGLPSGKPLQSLVSFLAKLPAALRKLKSMLDKNNVRIVNCHFPETDSVHFAVLRWLGIYNGKFVLSFHGEDIRVLGKKTGLGRWAAKWMMRRADAVIACSRGLMLDLVAFEPACAQAANVIYNAIDIDLLQSGIDRTFALPSALSGKQFLLNVARYEHKKGHDILIKAFEKVSSEFPDLMLVTMGTSIGEESARVRTMVQESSARERIIMLENVDHGKVGIFMEAATLFVLPSRREGFPFVLLEAGALQKPVVAAACIGVPEIIEDGVTGSLTPIEDPDAFAAAIVDLLRNSTKRDKLAHQLHSLVARDFNWKTAYEKQVSFGEAPCDSR